MQVDFLNDLTWSLLSATFKNKTGDSLFEFDLPHISDLALRLHLLILDFEASKTESVAAIRALCESGTQRFAHSHVCRLPCAACADAVELPAYVHVLVKQHLVH